MAHLIRVWRTSRIIQLLALLALLGTATQIAGRQQPKVIGSERLVSIDPLPEEGGEICEPVPPTDPANREAILMASLEYSAQARGSSFEAGNTATQDRSKLKPVRWIHDPYAAFSSVAVDPINNEVVMTDENRFQITIYNRTTRTHPPARLTAPHRITA